MVVWQKMLKAEDIVVWDILSRVGHGYDLEIVGLIRLLSVNWRMQTEAVDWHIGVMLRN